MKRSQSSLLALLILGVGLAAYGGLMAMRSDPQRKTAIVRPPLVETTVMEAAGATFQIHVDGTVVPKREITLAAEVAGRVVMRSQGLRAGNFVTQGALLLEIDDRSYKLEAKRLEEEHKQVQFDLDQIDVEEQNIEALKDIAQKELDLATREWERIKPLVKNRQASESTGDEAHRQVVKAQNALRTLLNMVRLVPTRRYRLQAQLQLTQARWEQAKLDLEKTKITSPISGVISYESVEENDFVQRGSVLLKIADTSVMEVKCYLRVDDLYWLWASSEEAPPSIEESGKPYYEVPRAPATVTYTIGGKNFDWSGFLARYEGIGVDSTTRTVPCRVEVPRPRRERLGDGPPALLTGMFVTVSLEVKPRTPLLEIPSQALRPGNQVWSVSKETAAATRSDARNAHTAKTDARNANTAKTEPPANSDDSNADAQGDEIASGAGAKRADAEIWTLRIHDVHVAKLLADSVLIRADSTTLRPGDELVVTSLVAIDGMQVRRKRVEKETAAGVR